MIDDAKALAETSECQPTSKFVSLAHALDTLLNGSPGRQFSYTASAAANDWDRLIWDLINAVGSQTGTVDSKTVSRGLAIITHWPSAVLPHNDDESGGGWGIPIIHLETESRPD